MRRRSFLVATGCATVGAGCLGRGPAGVHLSFLALANRHRDRQAAEVQIRDGDELVFSDTIQLQPRTDPALTLKHPVTGAGEYAVLVRAAGASIEVPVADRASAGEDCVGVTVAVAEDGDLESDTEPATDC